MIYTFKPTINKKSLEILKYSQTHKRKNNGKNINLRLYDDFKQKYLGIDNSYINKSYNFINKNNNTKKRKFNDEQNVAKVETDIDNLMKKNDIKPHKLHLDCCNNKRNDYNLNNYINEYRNLELSSNKKRRRILSFNKNKSLRNQLDYFLLDSDENLYRLNINTQGNEPGVVTLGGLFSGIQHYTKHSAKIERLKSKRKNNSV